MATPSHLKPPIARWIQGERKRAKLKPKDVADRLMAMGLDVGEQTVRVWESNAGRKPNAANLDGLERIFGSKAPVDEQTGDYAVREAIMELVVELRAERAERQRSEQGRLAVLRAALAGQVSEELLDALVPPPLGDAGQSGQDRGAA